MKITKNRIIPAGKSKVQKQKDNSRQQGIRKEVDFDGYVRCVEKKAYELYEKRGRSDGSDWKDWFEAERIVEEDLSHWN